MSGKVHQMKKRGMSVGALLVVFLVIAFCSATNAEPGPGTDTCVGVGATLDGTCTPLTNVLSGNNDNTASGSDALAANTPGSDNPASGFDALSANTTGLDNTASGFDALE